MNSRQRCIMIALLAFWLPFQALAGALVHCQQMSHAATDTEHVSGAADPECHGHPGERSKPDSDHSTDHDCVHCNGSCHGVQSLMSQTDRLTAHYIWPRPEAHAGASAKKAYLETPQRPPRQCS